MNLSFKKWTFLHFNKKKLWNCFLIYGNLNKSQFLREYTRPGSWNRLRMPVLYARDLHPHKPQLISYYLGVILVPSTWEIRAPLGLLWEREVWVSFLTVPCTMALPSHCPLEGSAHRMGTKMNPLQRWLRTVTVYNIYFSIKTLSNLVHQGKLF